MADASARNLAAALRDVQTLRAKRPTLDASCQALAAILPALFAELTGEMPLGSNRDRSADGIPLLREQQPRIDEASFRRRCQAVCAALNQPDAKAVADAVRRRAFEPVALLNAVLAGQPDAVAIHADSVGLNAALTATVLRLAALPALARIVSMVRPALNWEHGYCPACGSWPLLGETRGLEQDRHLRCGLCATAWPIARLRCPFCDNRDHRTLGYLHVEGEEDRFRAGTCDRCHGYVKWVSTMFPLPAPQLLVMDLATLHLDLAAAERGFFVP